MVPGLSTAAIMVRAPSIAAIIRPARTGGHTTGIARRNSTAAPKYAGTISNRATGLNDSAFMRRASTPTRKDGSAPTTIEAGRGPGALISIRGIDEGR